MGPILGLSSAALAFVLHIALWRVAVPRKPYKSLVLLWCATFALTLGAVALWRGWPAAPAIIYGAILGAALIVCYAIVYTGIEYDSPTLSVASEIDRYGEAGMPVGEIDSFSRQRPFIKKRLESIVADGIVSRRANGTLATTSNVGLLVKLSVAYRNWTGRVGAHG